MAKLIFKVNYFKPNHPNSRGGYARYIATRDGVEKDDSHIVLCGKVMTTLTMIS